MNCKIFNLVLLVPLFLIGCTNDSTSDLIDVTSLSGQVKYNQNIKSIVDINCTSCHGAIPSNGAPMALVTYQQVKNAVLNQGLIDRITRQNGQEGLMPLGGPRLPQNTIDVVLQWNTNGLQE